MSFCNINDISLVGLPGFPNSRNDFNLIGPTGPLGPTGPVGPQGETGPTGMDYGMFFFTQTGTYTDETGTFSTEYNFYNIPTNYLNSNGYRLRVYTSNTTFIAPYVIFLDENDNPTDQYLDIVKIRFDLSTKPPNFPNIDLFINNLLTYHLVNDNTTHLEFYLENDKLSFFYESIVDEGGDVYLMSVSLVDSISKTISDDFAFISSIANTFITIRNNIIMLISMLDKNNVYVEDLRNLKVGDEFTLVQGSESQQLMVTNMINLTYFNPNIKFLTLVLNNLISANFASTDININGTFTEDTFTFTGEYFTKRITLTTSVDITNIHKNSGNITFTFENLNLTDLTNTSQIVSVKQTSLPEVIGQHNTTQVTLGNILFTLDNCSASLLNPTTIIVSAVKNIYPISFISPVFFEKMIDVSFDIIYALNP